MGKGRETGVSRGGRIGKTVGFPEDKVAHEYPCVGKDFTLGHAVRCNLRGEVGLGPDRKTCYSFCELAKQKQNRCTVPVRKRKIWKTAGF